MLKDQEPGVLIHIQIQGPEGSLPQVMTGPGLRQGITIFIREEVMKVTGVIHLQEEAVLLQEAVVPIVIRQGAVVHTVLLPDQMIVIHHPEVVHLQEVVEVIPAEDQEAAVVEQEVQVAPHLAVEEDNKYG